jgi:alpha-L-fucosidase 2
MANAKRFATLCFLMAFFVAVSAKNGSPSLKLWYKQPANASVADSPNGWSDDKEWLNALPLGNGSFGAMVFGDVNKERIQLNEESMWSGSPNDNDNPDAFQHLNEIRQLLFEGRYKEATDLTNRTQVCKGAGSGWGNGAGVPYGCFQTLGELWIDWHKTAPYQQYHRELDLNNAVVRVSYVQDGVSFKREIFTSHPDQVMVARFTADKPGQISFQCAMNRIERYRTFTENNQLVMAGALSDGKGGDALQYMARLKAVAKNGTVTVTDSSIIIDGADEVVLLLSASTDYILHYPTYKGRDYKNITQQNIAAAEKMAYKELLASHTTDYKRYFDRVSLQLGQQTPDTIPTDKRLSEFKTSKNDNHLYELAFQYGRYLMISSSRPGTLPSNLQGLWANKTQTPWNGDYHTDVNIQMNYWPAEIANLSELHQPFFDLLASLQQPGTKTAQTQYHANGWVVHPITNVWGYTSPGEGADWGMHTGAPAWMCQHIGEHYRFTGDKKFLEKMYPTLKGSVAFYMDWLVKDPRTGKLVSGPAVSPENTFIAPDGSKCQISMGPTHDQQTIWQLFDDFIMASKELGVTDEWVAKVAAAKEQLAVTQIASDGRIMEWAQEFPEDEPGHRHISHLFAVHPGSQINLIETPELAQAAIKSIDYRISHGGGHTGWSAAWLINQYARLRLPENAKANLDAVLAKSMSPNLFGSCPPFQMDANFGTAAGVAEMLLQSHVQTDSGQYIIDLLPALPQAWHQGNVMGLKARGGITVDLCWKEGKLVKTKLTPSFTSATIIKYGDKQLPVRFKNGKSIVLTAKQLNQ